MQKIVADSLKLINPLISFSNGKYYKKTNFINTTTAINELITGGVSPIRVRTVLGNDHLQLAQPTHRCSISASGELQK